MSTKKGYINQISQDSGATTFSGTVLEGNTSIPFDNQVITNNSGVPITNADEVGYDSLLEFTEVNGKAQDCKACVQVRIYGTLNRPNTSPQIKNLVNAIEKETGTGIGVLITKG